MLKTILFISLASSSLGYKVSRSLHSISHNSNTTTSVHDNCVDVSRYEELHFVPSEDVCTSSIKATCIPRSQKVCVSVPKTSCTFSAGVDCTHVPTTQSYRCDRTEEKNFTPKKCVPNGFKTITEVKRVPHCHNVTKDVCDSKWIIDASGNKVFADNVNCKPKTWQKCELVDKVHTEKVQIKNCVDEKKPLFYLNPVFETMEVTSYRRSCAAVGGASCQVTYIQECTEVTWSDCTDEVDTTCKPLPYNSKVQSGIPTQEYIHLKRCALGVKH